MFLIRCYEVVCDFLYEYIYMNKVFHLLYSFCCCVCNGSDLRRVAKERR